MANIQGMFALAGETEMKLPLDENVPKDLKIKTLPIDHDPVIFDSVECRRANEMEDWLFSNDSDFREVSGCLLEIW